MSDTESQGQVGKNWVLYPPRSFLRAIGAEEGSDVLFELKDNRIIVQTIPDPLSFAVRGKKFWKTTVEEFEAESEAEQQNNE